MGLERERRKEGSIEDKRGREEEEKWGENGEKQKKERKEKK